MTERQRKQIDKPRADLRGTASKWLFTCDKLLISKVRAGKFFADEMVSSGNLNKEQAMSIAVPMNLPTTKTIRRAPKERAANQPFHQADPYATLMECWVTYMRVDDRDLGSRGMRLASDAGADRDVHTEQYMADIKIGEAVNAMVDSLTIQQRWAICKSQRISAVWRFPNANYEAVLAEAREALEEKLKKNVATRLYWA